MLSHFLSKLIYFEYEYFVDTPTCKYSETLAEIIIKKISALRIKFCNIKTMFVILIKVSRKYSYYSIALEEK